MRRISFLCVILALALLPGMALARAGLASSNIPYRGGPVMHNADVVPIFWVPPGYQFHPAGSAASDSDYENLILQFLGDLGDTPFYDAMASQYTDSRGPIGTSLSVENGIVDNTPFPRGSGSITKPLMDSEIRAEILAVINDQQIENQPLTTAFFVYMPFDVQVCSRYDPSATSNPGCTYRPGNKGRCGYHSYLKSHGQRFVYAVITNTASFCHSWETKVTDDNAPNGDMYGDITVDVTSHELFEALTDPYLNAWTDSTNTAEVGDKCSSYIGPIADTGGDILLNGDPYIIQKEWSNKDRGCIL